MEGGEELHGAQRGNERQERGDKRKSGGERKKMGGRESR